MLHIDAHVASRLGPNFGIALAIGVLLAACGGGGGGGSGGGGPVDSGFGNSLPASTGPGDAENFFPDSPGSSWNYFVTTTDISGGTPTHQMDSVSVTGTKVVGGQTANVFLESNPEGTGMPIEAYYLKNAGGIAFLGTNDATDTITAASVPQIVALFPAAPGVVANFSKSGIDFGSDLDGDGINETVNFTVTNAIVGFEPLAIGIGSFERTVRTSEATSGAVRLSWLRTDVPFSVTATRWLAPGVGVIRNTQTVTVDTITASETMEARGYVSNGIAHGFGLPYRVASNLAPGDSNYYNPGPPGLATDGQNFLAVSASGGAITGALFDPQGAPITSIALGSGAAPIAGFDGTNYWVIYLQSPGGSTACFAQRVSTAGTVLDATPINIALGTTSISGTAVAFGANNGLVAYSRYNNVTSQHELFGVLVAPDGTVQGAGAFPIATDNSTHLNPAVSFDGTNYFVVWAQMATSGATLSHIEGVRVSPAGAVVDSSPIAISDAPNGQSHPSVAFDGSNYLVVWLDLRNSGTIGMSYPDVYGARVSSAGVLLDGAAATGGFAISSGGSQQRYSPYVAFNGSEYLATWAFLGYANTGSPGIQAARVSTSGALPAGTDMAIMVSGPPDATTVSQLVFPVIAAGPQRAAVVWLDNTGLSSSQKGLVGASVFPF